MQIQRIGKHLASALALILLLLLGASCSAPVRVDWSTETEINTAGFNIYRGESPDGPFDVKINEQLIPPSPDPMTGGKYNYVDNTAQIGKLYYYQLEEVERNGTQTKLGVTPARAGGSELADATRPRRAGDCRPDRLDRGREASHSPARCGQSYEQLRCIPIQ